MPFWGGSSFQNLLGEVFSGLESLHDIVMVWLIAILAVVCILSIRVFSKTVSHMRLDSEVLEVTWTIIPVFVLLSIAIPSIRLLYMQDVMCVVPTGTLKLTSNQWNWQSEVEESNDHLLDADGLDNLGSFEAPLALRQGVSRLLITSTDVLHSLGVPSLGLKLDSAPGRLNATLVEVASKGNFLGSCYELCGSGHSAMPIHLLSV